MLLMCGCAASSHTDPIPQSNLQQLVRQSRFIFKGTVQQVRATTTSIVPATDSTIVVRVDEVLRAPTLMGDLTGRDVTVQVQPAPPARVGAQRVFFANAWLYGQTIALVEVGRIPASQDTTALLRQVGAALQNLADQDLRDRLARAEIVIAGEVSSTEPLGDQGRRRPITEHDPDWWRAVIRIGSMEKGDVPDDTLTILFPNSSDEVWIDSPKFQVGQRGIWILQTDQDEKGMPATREPGRTALDPLDYQTMEELERVRRLIRGRQ